ncbi:MULTISPECIES: SDR family oxidoreductase [Aeromonas]|jgi:3-oxoacyl-[acyl-carrier protein] reductase|uniref:SDR family oxidoreductase n=4 Tax=Aeromonas TaxID=642 RepID=A0AAE7AHN0_AERME|nr:MULTISPECIES: SDR family oxidoreductase [Aeromonas]AHX61106.1 3-ketoacyl- reductase [Aeromonas media WS]MBS4638705.1 SDR family oxidoreductase [Aeromonas media]MCV3289299.1 SDR family oxidoreductase [Aeromonas media]MCY9836947.1 SDR family oxidoreductase [Aeromonas media]QHQ51520.1 SDR family oxidoreductase [Aeromonas media]
MDITEKVIAITGAGRGLGRAIALRLASQGAVLALIDVNRADLEVTEAEVRSRDGRCALFVCNVADEPEVEATFAAMEEQLGALHGLVNCAGILRDGMLIKMKEGELVEKMSLSQWQAVIDVNLTGTFLCGREGAALMAKGGQGGVIINISSIARAGNIGQSNYAASKAGVASLVVTWGRELARHGIRVMGIAPGVFATDMTAAMKPEAMARMQQAIPVGALGQGEQLAQTVQFILANDYLSGRIIDLDGGLRL